MLKILIILVFLVFYTYLLKRRFKVKMMEAWRAEKVGAEVMVYVMIVLPVILAWLLRCSLNIFFPKHTLIHE